MTFYAIFAAALFLPARLRLSAILAVLGILALAGRLWPADGTWRFYTDPIILEFGAGLLVGVLYTSGRAMPGAIAGAVAAAGLFLFGLGVVYDAALPRVALSGVPAGLIVGGLVMLEKRHPFRDLRLPRRLGDASYSIYLTHVITLAALTKLLGPLHTGWPTPWAPSMALYLAAAAIVGPTVYRFVETPANALARRVWPDAPAQTVPAEQPADLRAPF
jgi:exopolysaccharide production protein ExoZ